MPLSALNILFEDESLIVVDKPAGLLTHRNERNPLEPNCMHQLRDQIGMWVYPAHRLDRATSGLLIFAKNAEVARALVDQFTRRAVEKTYEAIVRGWSAPSGEIHHPLREEKHLEPVAAETRYVTLRQVEIPISVTPHPSARYSWVQCFPKTGRMHQIRKHLHHISHPVIGDVNYGVGVHNRLWRTHFGIYRLLLFATEIRFIHPSTGAPLHLQAPGPEVLLAPLTQLQWNEITPRDMHT